MTKEDEREKQHESFANTIEDGFENFLVSNWEIGDTYESMTKWIDSYIKRLSK